MHFISTEKLKISYLNITLMLDVCNPLLYLIIKLENAVTGLISEPLFLSFGEEDVRAMFCLVVKRILTGHFANG